MSGPLRDDDELAYFARMVEAGTVRVDHARRMIERIRWQREQMAEQARWRAADCPHCGNPQAWHLSGRCAGRSWQTEWSHGTPLPDDGGLT